MTRVVIFCLFLCGLVLVMNMSSYSDVKVNNSYFDFEKAKNAHFQHKADLLELAKIHKNAVSPKVSLDEGAVVVKTIIPLDTPQLQRAHKLYKQCISCHGKAGEGKKANKAPQIGGQMNWYITKQLSDMKAKLRINKNMATIMKKLSAEDIDDLAAYISKLPW